MSRIDARRIVTAMTDKQVRRYVSIMEHPGSSVSECISSVFMRTNSGYSPVSGTIQSLRVFPTRVGLDYIVPKSIDVEIHGACIAECRGESSGW